eukprot:28836_1
MNVSLLQNAIHAKELTLHYNSIKDNTDEYIIKYFEQYNHLMDDYHHILTQHLNDNDDAQLVYAQISQSIQCDIVNCHKYRRNNRNRQLNNKTRQTNTNRRESAHFMVYEEFLNTIHCYFIHELNETFKFENMYDKHDNKDDNKKLPIQQDLDILDSSELYHDKQVKKLKTYLA